MADTICADGPTVAAKLLFDAISERDHQYLVVDPEAFGTGIEGTVDRYVGMTRATQQLVILTST